MGRLLIYGELSPLKSIRFSRTHLWRLERAGKFPKRIHVGDNSIAWDEDEIDAYLNAKRRERDMRRQD